MTVSIARGISESDIARRAFELYCARGGQHGQDLEDWLRAERELIGNPATRARPAFEMATAPDSGTKGQPRKRAPRKPASLD